MEAEEVSGKGYEVPSREATWVCVESKPTPTPGTADGVDYFMTFAARGTRTEETPATRELHLRTSSFRISQEPDFLGFLALVVDGQLLQTTPWDRFTEVFARD